MLLSATIQLKATNFYFRALQSATAFLFAISKSETIQRACQLHFTFRLLFALGSKVVPFYLRFFVKLLCCYIKKKTCKASPFFVAVHYIMLTAVLLNYFKIPCSKVHLNFAPLFYFIQFKFEILLLWCQVFFFWISHVKIFLTFCHILLAI